MRPETVGNFVCGRAVKHQAAMDEAFAEDDDKLCLCHGVPVRVPLINIDLGRGRDKWTVTETPIAHLG